MKFYSSPLIATKYVTLASCYRLYKTLALLRFVAEIQLCSLFLKENSETHTRTSHLTWSSCYGTGESRVELLCNSLVSIQYCYVALGWHFTILTSDTNIYKISSLKMQKVGYHFQSKYFLRKKVLISRSKFQCVYKLSEDHVKQGFCSSMPEAGSTLLDDKNVPFREATQMWLSEKQHMRIC